MNAAHLHLLMNHFPIVGTLLAVPLLLLAWRSRDRGVWLAGTVLLAIAGGTAAAAFVTGEPAEEVVEDLAGVDSAALETHEERAEVATVATVLVAVGAIAAYARGRRRPWLVAAPAVGAVLAGALTAWAGAAGGQIRHPEVGGPIDGTISRGEDD